MAANGQLGDPLPSSSSRVPPSHPPLALPSHRPLASPALTLPWPPLLILPWRELISPPLASPPLSPSLAGDAFLISEDERQVRHLATSPSSHTLLPRPSLTFPLSAVVQTRHLPTPPSHLSLLPRPSLTFPLSAARQAKARKKEMSDRAIDSLRHERQGTQSDEYRCSSCKGTRCNLFHTNSMGAVHLTAVPDMIIECLDCGHRFTI